MYVPKNFNLLDCRFDSFRNGTAVGMTITHLPTGVRASRDRDDVKSGSSFRLRDACLQELDELLEPVDE